MDTFVFVGLGNPGEKYASTRHNLGIRAVEAWVESQRATALSFSDWRETGLPAGQAGGEAGTGSEAIVTTGEGDVVTARVVAFFPGTFMNSSGEAVHSFIAQQKLDQHSLVVVHDDVELPLGEVRLVTGGSAKGHKGVRSIHQALGTVELKRLRLGVGRPSDETPLEAYVLQPFTSAEEGPVTAMIDQACGVLTQIARRGFAAVPAINR